MLHLRFSSRPSPTKGSAGRFCGRLKRSPAGPKRLGPAFGRTDFSQIFIFEPPDFFADFLAGFFLLIFVGKSAQKNPPGKSPGKSSKIYTTKILQDISADCPGQKRFSGILGAKPSFSDPANSAPNIGIRMRVTP